MKNFGQILVVAGQPEQDTALVHQASAIAGRQRARLTVLDVRDYLVSFGELLGPDLSAEDLKSRVMRHRADQIRASLLAEGSEESLAGCIKLRDGIPFIEIIEETLEHGHDLIVKYADSSRPGPHRHFDSIDMHLMRKSPSPVWIVRSNETAPPSRVAVALDVIDLAPGGDEFTRRILGLAATLVDADSVQLRIVSSCELMGEETMRSNPFLNIDDARIEAMHADMEARMAARHAELADWYARRHPDAPPLLCHRARGEAASVIPRFVEDRAIDLLVLGTVDHIEVSSLMIGNTAEAILDEVACSVLTVKPEGFVSPVKPGLGVRARTRRRAARRDGLLEDCLAE